MASLASIQVSRPWMALRHAANMPVRRTSSAPEASKHQPNGPRSRAAVTGAGARTRASCAGRSKSLARVLSVSLSIRIIIIDGSVLDSPLGSLISIVRQQPLAQSFTSQPILLLLLLLLLCCCVPAEFWSLLAPYSSKESHPSQRSSLLSAI